MAKNAVAIERLHKLAYIEFGEVKASLGRYGLGSSRLRAAFERFDGIDLANKRVRLDVYRGVSPDPFTIRCEDDWARRMTFEGYLKIADGQRPRRIASEP